MAALFAVGACWACGQTFTFDPDIVPSISGAPLCRDCVALANGLRVRDGIPEIIVYEGTYPNED